jgi:hypothetical protein
MSVEAPEDLAQRVSEAQQERALQNAPLTPEEETKLRAAWKLIGAWEMTESPDENLEYTCPLCNGEGYTDGFRLDAQNITPATIGGYGIGEGLGAAELVANSVGRLLATLDIERARTRLHGKSCFSAPGLGCVCEEKP